MFSKYSRNNQMRSGASCQLCSLKKLFLKIFGKFIENHLHHSTYLKLKDILNMSWCFSRNFPKILTTAIIEKLLMDVPYFANEKPLDGCFWWDNTKQKLVKVKPPQSWPWKQNGAMTVAAVMIHEIVTSEEGCSR